MIRMRCTVQDFMTREPIQGCVLRVQLLVAPRFEERIDDPDAPEGPDKPSFGPVPDFTLAQGSSVRW